MTLKNFKLSFAASLAIFASRLDAAPSAIDRQYSSVFLNVFENNEDLLPIIEVINGKWVIFPGCPKSKSCIGNSKKRLIPEPVIPEKTVPQWHPYPEDQDLAALQNEPNEDKTIVTRLRVDQSDEILHLVKLGKYSRNLRYRPLYPESWKSWRPLRDEKHPEYILIRSRSGIRDAIPLNFQPIFPAQNPRIPPPMGPGAPPDRRSMQF